MAWKITSTNKITAVLTKALTIKPQRKYILTKLFNYLVRDLLSKNCHLIVYTKGSTLRFKSVLVSKDEQLLHLTRYIHLNPTSAGLVKYPEKWSFSSYNEYINNTETQGKICKFDNLFSISPKEYKKFVSDRKLYQKEISRIKKLLIEDYTG